MRRLSLVGAGLAALCLAVPPASAADSSESVIFNYLAAWNMQNPARAADYFAYDVKYYDVSMDLPVVGRDAARLSIMANLLGSMPDAMWGLRGMRVVDDGSVALEWVVSGTDTGMGAGGTMPTGRHVELSGASLFKVVDGKIVYEADYYGGARPEDQL